MRLSVRSVQSRWSTSARMMSWRQARPITMQYMTSWHPTYSNVIGRSGQTISSIQAFSFFHPFLRQICSSASLGSNVGMIIWLSNHDGVYRMKWHHDICTTQFTPNMRLSVKMRLSVRSVQSQCSIAPCMMSWRQARPITMQYMTLWYSDLYKRFLYVPHF